jgi:hypothetical protein
VKKETLTGRQINESTLGTVPVAETADVAGSLAAPENWHIAGIPGEPQLLSGWAAEEPVGYFKDREGIVHLKGLVKAGSQRWIFQLPSGYRPAAGTHLKIPAACEGGHCGADGASAVEVRGTELPDHYMEGVVAASEGATAVSLSGITFRAES